MTSLKKVFLVAETLEIQTLMNIQGKILEKKRRSLMISYSDGRKEKMLHCYFAKA